MLDFDTLSPHSYLDWFIRSQDPLNRCFLPPVNARAPMITEYHENDFSQVRFLCDTPNAPLLTSFLTKDSRIPDWNAAPPASVSRLAVYRMQVLPSCHGLPWSSCRCSALVLHSILNHSEHLLCIPIYTTTQNLSNPIQQTSPLPLANPTPNFLQSCHPCQAPQAPPRRSRLGR